MPSVFWRCCWAARRASGL